MAVYPSLFPVGDCPADALLGCYFARPSDRIRPNPGSPSRESLKGASVPSKEELKQQAFQEIDRRSAEIIGISKTILANPEPGFREVKTAKLVADKFAELGIPFRSGLESAAN